MTDAVVYARVSTREQSAEPQLAELRRVAGQRGWSVMAELVDIGSGARADLPGRSRVLEAAERAEIGIVAVWRLDRLGRSVRDLVEAVETLRRCGVELVSLRDSIDTTSPAGRLVFHVLAAVAELERELIRERVVAGLARARRAGREVGRPRAAMDVGEAREMLARGHSMRRVAERLGVSPRTLRRRLGSAERPGGRGQNPASNDEPEVPEITDPNRDQTREGTK